MSAADTNVLVPEQLETATRDRDPVGSLRVKLEGIASGALLHRVDHPPYLSLSGFGVREPRNRSDRGSSITVVPSPQLSNS